jgi:hypothetical protein
VSTAERFSPRTGTWTAAGDTGAARLRDVATALDDGRVLDCGGFTPDGHPLSSCAVYSPDTNIWHHTSDLPEPVGDPVAVRLAHGEVLVAGGETGADDHVTAATQLWDPFSGAWRALGPLSAARASSAAALLADGSVLVCGGVDDNLDALGVCDRLAPDYTWTSAPPLRQARFDFMMPLTTAASEQDVLAIGGSVGWYTAVPGPVPNTDVEPTATVETDHP